VEAVPTLSQKESTPKLCGGSSPQISKRFHPKNLWRQFPPILKKNSPKNSVDQILWREFPPHIKKNPLQNSAEAVPATSQKESTPKLCGGSSRHISKRIHSKILWRQFNSRHISKRIQLKILRRQFPPHLKKNPLQYSVEAVPATSQKQSTPKFCGGSSRHISKRIQLKILRRQFPPHLKKNPLQNSVEAVPATSQKESPPKFCGGSSRHISKRNQPKILWREFPPHLKKNPQTLTRQISN